MKLSERVSRRIREAREKRGLTQSDMARKLHLKAQGYGAYERYADDPDLYTAPSLDRLEQIARALEYPVTYFVADKEEAPTMEADFARLYQKLDAKQKAMLLRVVKLLVDVLK